MHTYFMDNMTALHMCWSHTQYQHNSFQQQTVSSASSVIPLSLEAVEITKHVRKKDAVTYVSILTSIHERPY